MRLPPVDYTRATTVPLASLWPWHFGASVPSTGPVFGTDRLAGLAPFGLDPFELVALEAANNPNIAVSGAPANGKSAFVKAMLWLLVGTRGYRMVATDPKGEYQALADELGVPVLDLHPGGSQRVNPLDAVEGRLEFIAGLSGLCVGRSLQPEESAVLAQCEPLLGPGALVGELLGLLRAMPATVTDRLVMTRDDALDATRALRFGIGELLEGELAGMYDGPTNVDLTSGKRGVVIDVSACRTDDRVLRFAMLTARRAVDQMLVKAQPIPTIDVADEAWRLAGIAETVRYLQHRFKLGRHMGIANVIVTHRFSELGNQADGVTGAIASKLVSDADTQVMFRQGDRADAEDTVERLSLPPSLVDALLSLRARRCLISVRGRLALMDVALPPRLLSLADTNVAMRATGKEFSENVA